MFFWMNFPVPNIAIDLCSNNNLIIWFHPFSSAPPGKKYGILKCRDIFFTFFCKTQ